MSWHYKCFSRNIYILSKTGDIIHSNENFRQIMFMITAVVYQWVNPWDDSHDSTDLTLILSIIRNKILDIKLFHLWCHNFLALMCKFLTRKSPTWCDTNTLRNISDFLCASPTMKKQLTLICCFIRSRRCTCVGVKHYFVYDWWNFFSMKLLRYCPHWIPKLKQHLHQQVWYCVNDWFLNS